MVLTNNLDPQFVTCNMTTVVQEGAKPGQALLTASITDADVTDQGEIWTLLNFRQSL